MKKILFSIIITLLFNSVEGVFAQQEGTLAITIKSLRTDDGKVAVAVHNGPDGFPGGEENMIQAKSVTIKDGEAYAKFENLPFGEYAISVFHDENDNLELDTNWIGIPKEGVGASNNAKGRMGPPKYEDAKFDFKVDNQKIEFDMSYF